MAPALAGGLRELLSAGLAEGWSDILPLLETFEVRNRDVNKAAAQAALQTANLLQQQGIEPVFLKGLAFILEAGDNAPWRLISDIDVLIPTTDGPDAINALRNAGYATGGDEAAYSPALHHHLVPMIVPITGLSVELHTRVCREQYVRMPAETILKRSVQITSGGSELNIASPADRAVHLVVHAQISNMGYRARQLNLRDCLDLVRLSQMHQLDWQQIVDLCTDAGVGVEAVAFIAAVQDFMATDFGIAATPAAQTWARQATNHLHHPPHAWKSWARMCAFYATRYIRNPVQIATIFRNAINPKRRSALARTIGKRLSK